MLNFLSFSDSAKYADIAKNIYSGLGYISNFTFWSQSVFKYLKIGLFSSSLTPPVMPFSIAAFFKIFGVNDFAVIATSIFYFVLTLFFTYLLGKKIFNSKLVGALSTLAVGASYDLIHYATNGASESPFIFEIVAGLYFASLRKKWASFITVLFLVLMYFTRPQAFIYIAGIILYWLLVNFKIKKALVFFVGVLGIGLLVDHFILLPLNGKYFLYSILGRGLESGYNQSSTASDVLRGVAVVAPSIFQIAKNIFYNLYNFYKALPDIINPYFFALFVIGLFIPPSRKATEGQVNLQSGFKLSSIFMILVTLLVTAASIPFYRYLHPVIPLVYIIAMGTIVTIINYQLSISNKFSIFRFHFSKQIALLLITFFLIVLFGVGQTVGKFVLDSRFEAKTYNVGKPPMYVELSKILKENTEPDDVVITNLDTWGSWYGERKTIWFPVEPKQLIDPSTGEIPFDAIYLTSYKIDDANYYMGENWRMVFENPKDPSKWKCDGCSEIVKRYGLKGIYKVSFGEDYEKEDATAILLIKK